jgi:hypothetical protein
MKKEHIELGLLKQIQDKTKEENIFSYVFDNVFNLLTQIELVKEKQRCERENLPFDTDLFSEQTKDLMRQDLEKTEYHYLIDEWKI